MEVWVAGQGRVVLTQADFKAGGGEGDVYVKAQTAYKLYHDPARIIPPGKIAELSKITRPEVIRPLDLLQDAQQVPIGYTMRAIPAGIPLIQTFTQAFRSREGLTPDMVNQLVQLLRDGVGHVHQAGMLIVDLNELNFLVDPGFTQVYFIDVDSYQTPSYPATALMESVRDRHCTQGNWNVGTDWFSFAVVSFQMYTGIHPFKGKHPKLKTLDDRMLANVSVLSREVAVPAVTLPFSVIPTNFLEWYRAVFERGMRVAPPLGLMDTIVLTSADLAVKHQTGSDNFEILKIEEDYGKGEIVAVQDGFVLTTNSLYYGPRRLCDAPAGTVLAVTSTGQAILAWKEKELLCLKEAASNKLIPIQLTADQVMAANGRLFLKRGSSLEEVEFVEVGTKIIPRARPIGNVLPQASQMYDGVVMQNLLGAHYASLFPEPFTCRQIRLAPLDGYRVLTAGADGRVLIVLAEKSGRYNQFLFRFSADFATYDVRKTEDVAFAAINFARLDTGICALMTPGETLEIFAEAKDSLALRTITDPALEGDVRLFRRGGRMLFARVNSLYRLSIKR